MSIFPQNKQSERGSVLIVTIGIVSILMLIVAVTLMSTTNKYFTAYQWASWQEALQGAESGADILMGELRKDAQNNGAIAWVGWKVGTYSGYDSKDGHRLTDPSSEKTIGATGYFANNSGQGQGNSTPFSVSYFSGGAHPNDYVTYSTSLTAHGGEGNQNLKMAVTMDAPSTLLVSGKQWLRVVATGTTDLAGPVRASEEALDNRLRKIGFFFDRMLGFASTGGHPVASRRIELVAKPVSMFSGALMAMVQIKTDAQGLLTDSYNSEDLVNWPLDANGNVIMSKNYDPTTSIGKNGDIASNAFPIKHDHSEDFNIDNDFIYGDVGNNYSKIKGLDPTYYSTAANPNNYGLDNGNYGSSNPSPTLIDAKGHGDVSGAISTNFYRDLPPVSDPNWDNSQITKTYYPAKSGQPTITAATADYVVQSSNPSQPDRIVLTGSNTSIQLANKDKWTLKPKTVGQDAYVEIWAQGNIKLDDGGTFVIAPGVHATVYFDHDLKVGEGTETKTNGGGIDVQSDDAKDLVLLGVTQTDANKLPKDEYIDPLGNDAVYTPYKASGNILLKGTDFTGAIYAPDHNIIMDNDKDGKGKRRKRIQYGNDYYGSYVGRTINIHKAANIHFDESLNDWGPVKDWGYISWFEDVDVDRR